MLGAIIGDVVGSRFEFNNTNETDFEFFHKSCDFTDDTVMTLAVAKSLLNCNGDYTNLYECANTTLREVGRRHPYCGYGGMFINWMFDDSIGPYNSFGNGSAMRISAVGNVAKTVEEAKDLSYKVTAVTHNHLEGLKGAECVAVCMVLAKEGKSKDEIKAYIDANYGYDTSKSVNQWRKEINKMHGAETCQVSIPQALSCFLESENFEDCIRKCISIGGDSDTIAAIAGAIAEEYYGIPEGMVIAVREFLSADLLEILDEFESKFGK